MSTAPVYVGEADGGRILKLDGGSLTQVTSAGSASVLFDAKTWDLVPSGSSGDNVFRMVIATIRFTNGYAVRITPSVDGVDLAAQDFSGAGDDTLPLQAWVAERGARIAVRVQQLTRTGDFELVNVEVAFVPIRVVP